MRQTQPPSLQSYDCRADTAFDAARATHTGVYANYIQVLRHSLRGDGDKLAYGSVLLAIRLDRLAAADASSQT